MVWPAGEGKETMGHDDFTTGILLLFDIVWHIVICIKPSNKLNTRALNMFIKPSKHRNFSSFLPLVGMKDGYPLVSRLAQACFFFCGRSSSKRWLEFPSTQGRSQTWATPLQRTLFDSVISGNLALRTPSTHRQNLNYVWTVFECVAMISTHEKHVWLKWIS